MEIYTKNYNKQKNYLLLYLLYLSIYTYISYIYTILCLSPPQRPLYYEIITIDTKSTYFHRKRMIIPAKNYNKQWEYTKIIPVYTEIFLFIHNLAQK